MRPSVTQVRSWGSTMRFALVAAAVVGILSCDSAPRPFIINGPGGDDGNEPPTLQITRPDDNITIGQGDRFLIEWIDSDRDDDAQISFLLVSGTTNARTLLVSGVSENVEPGLFSVATSLIAPGPYSLVGIIDDGVNAPVESFAIVGSAAGGQPVQIIIAEEGTGPQTIPPTVAVTEPEVNLSVAQDDQLLITIQANDTLAGAVTAFDVDSSVRLFVVLDVDRDPNNDDPANPDPSRIIVISERTILDGTTPGPITILITIDLTRFPPLPGGAPYFIRATIDDGTNPRVHSYAVGTLSIVQLAAGVVDLNDIGRTKSGAKFQGFNPGAMLGSSLTTVTDFDGDGVDDFMVAARFGNPQNAGPVGEAYLIYGKSGERFGGTVSVNAVSGAVAGVIFQGPPVRNVDAFLFGRTRDELARTDGITDVSFIRDLTGDGRPELLFGLSHVHGAFDSTDYDPGDDQQLPQLGCYPDLVVNNLNNTIPTRDFDAFYAGGMAVMVNSENRDSSPRITPTPARLDTTSIALELVGQIPVILNTSGISDPTNPLEFSAGSIFPRADNAGVAGATPSEPDRIAGARFVAGGFDAIDAFALDQAPRDGLVGKNVASIGDLNSDGLDEIIVSAPTNQRYLQDLADDIGLASSTQIRSTIFRGDIIIYPGRDYNQVNQRDDNNDEGTCRQPRLDNFEFAPFGSCATQVARHYVLPTDIVEVFPENINDMLGGASSAGDFNRGTDRLDDILCGAPLNDRSPTRADTGAVYVIYSRTPFGVIRLSNADDPILRAPMLRIRGNSINDQIGWRQTAGLDVNGDRVDDVFFGSPRTDFGPISRATCGDDFNRDGFFDQNDLRVSSFNGCAASNDELFSDDRCKVFDYDNDGDVDDDDRCVFCCLSSECNPDNSCILGGKTGDCCENLVDNGFVGIVFGGVSIDGDRDLDQLATTELPGAKFFGSAAGHRAGMDVASAGDFNQDGFGDILIAVPGEVRRDAAGRERLGVVYLIFGGTHLTNTTWNLSSVGSDDLPGIVFLSPYVKGRPNEAAPTTVGFIGDINDDGFGDIAIGNPLADFIDPSFPQGPDAPGSDAATGRRSNVGDAYIIYGNNFGSNRDVP